MPNIQKALQDSVVEDIIIKPVQETTKNTMIFGRISVCDEIFIYIEITEGITELLSWNMNEFQLFDIIFYKNRTTFQLQHNALNYVKQHRLFSILINNPKYAIEHQSNQLPEIQLR